MFFCRRDLDDVPDQEEVAGEPEPPDDPQLARELRAHLGAQRIVRGVAAADAGRRRASRGSSAPSRRPARRSWGRCSRDRRARTRQRSAIARVARERRRGGRANSAAISRGDFSQRSPFGRQAPADLVDGALFARAGEDVVDAAAAAASRSGRRWSPPAPTPERRRLRRDRALVPGLARVEVALHLQVDVRRARTPSTSAGRSSRGAAPPSAISPRRVLGQQRRASRAADRPWRAPRARGSSSRQRFW